MKLYDYTGVIHLHSSFSFDGHAPMEQIIQSAEKNGIDFLMLTDHDHLKARHEGWEGWQGTTLVIVGEEIAPRFNHYLAFKIKEPVVYSDDPEGINPQKYIDAVNDQGGFGFIAHPDHEGTAMFHVKHYSWNDWKIGGYTGIGVWDFMTDWQNSLCGYFSGLMSFLFPAYFLKGPHRITLERWDTLNQVKKTVGIGKLDNHATIKKLLGFPLVAFPFDRAFKFIRTHVLTESCPEKARIRIIRNGLEWNQKTTNRFSMPFIKTGIYRVEVYLKSAGKFRPWIFSNPIFVNEFQ